MARARCRLRDWLFSGPGKLRLLEQLLLEDPARLWTRTQLAAAAGQHKKARVDLYLGPLLQAGVVRRSGGSYEVDHQQPLTAALTALVTELRQLPDDDLHR